MCKNHKRAVLSGQIWYVPHAKTLFLQDVFFVFGDFILAASRLAGHLKAGRLAGLEAAGGHDKQ